MRIHNGFNSVFGMTVTIILSLFMFLTLPVTPSALDLNRGANLRQNALLMSWPSGMNKLIFPTGSFGISETRIRVWSSVYCGGVVVNGALESRASFTSSNSGSLGEGSIFGKSKPLEHWDMTVNHIEEQTTSLSSRIERLDIRWNVGGFDLNIGRQPVSLGTSHFVGFLDILAPFAPGDLDATYKPGIDAIRILRGMGISSEAVFGKTLRKHTEFTVTITGM